MRHFVLTRSAYGPAWSPEANERRLRITEGICARLMSVQTSRDWTWIVLLDRRDPLLRRRLEVFEAAAPAVEPIYWLPPEQPEQASWDRAKRTTTVQRIAAEAYRAPWLSTMGGLPDGFRLMTRLDDDDGLAPDALARTAHAARRLTSRSVLMQPVGVRVYQGRSSPVVHDENAMHSLFVPAGDRMTVYDYGHRLVKRVAPIVTVDHEPAWLWVRHVDTISGHRVANQAITSGLRRLFPIDWSLVA